MHTLCLTILVSEDGQPLGDPDRHHKLQGRPQTPHEVRVRTGRCVTKLASVLQIALLARSLDSIYYGSLEWVCFKVVYTLRNRCLSPERRPNDMFRLRYSERWIVNRSIRTQTLAVAGRQQPNSVVLGEIAQA